MQIHYTWAERKKIHSNTFLASVFCRLILRHSFLSPHISSSLPLRALNINGRSASELGAREPCVCPYHHGTPPVSGPAVTVEAVIHGHTEMDTEMPRNLGFRLHMTSKAAWCVVMNFGDSSGVQVKTHNVSEEMTVTTYHWYRKGRTLILILGTEERKAEVYFQVLKYMIPKIGVMHKKLFKFFPELP